eukprot:GGOE01043613.1.p1 GENE.GGOE01043613.1~~GGOE01043613.1.p1  ORF type:complete len:525 (+),score=93.12 GGOE01043613.1:89-1663(+)
MRIKRPVRRAGDAVHLRFAPLLAGLVVMIWLLTSRRAVYRVTSGAASSQARTRQRAVDDARKKSHSGAQWQKRDAVREAFLFAWQGYRRYAWGGDELKPLSRKAKNWGKEYGRFGLTILESMDTLWIMQLHDEFERCVEWVARDLRFDIDHEISHFEATIRMLGGLLSAFELSGKRHHVLLRMAQDLGDRLLFAYNTTLGIPHQTVNLATGESGNPSWMSNRAALAEFGSVQLEFKTLSHHTGDPTYRKKAMRVFDVLERQVHRLSHPGLWPIWINMDSGLLVEDHLTLGARGDSFYEVLLKQWLLTGKREGRLKRLFYEAAVAIQQHLVHRSSPSGLTYIAEMKDSMVYHTMDHLVCFSGGMFALAANEWSSPKESWMGLAKAIGETCHAIYDMTVTGLGPEIVDFQIGMDAIPHSWKYILRPEAAETWFYLWRYTKDERWRDYGWKLLKNLNRHCRVQGGGFAGVRNVSEVPAEHDDLMQSFFLAETLKYLYLMFDEPGHLSLDDWVFSTEAHPFQRHRPRS